MLSSHSGSASEADTASARLWGEDTLQHWGKGQGGVQRSLWGSSDCPKAVQPGCPGLQADIPQSLLISFCVCFAQCSLKQVRAEKCYVGSHLWIFTSLALSAGSGTLSSDCSSLGPGNRVGALACPVFPAPHKHKAGLAFKIGSGRKTDK